MSARLTSPRRRALSRAWPVAIGALGVALVLTHTSSAPAEPLGESSQIAVFDGAVLDDLGEQAGLVAARKPLTQARPALGLASTGTATRVSAKASTRAAARPLWARMPALTLGSTGAAVLTVQKRLSVRPTAFFGPLTRTAVRAFQARHHLPQVGKVGPLTWRALLSRPVARSQATSRTAKPSTPAAPRVSAPVTAGRTCPAPGASFGQGWGAQRAGHLHQGMDLVGRRGSPVLAIESGVIIREGRQSNGALRIVMQGASGSKFYYGHMSSDLVHAGQRVRRGQVIGLMGDSGSPGAVHLHFEYWRSGGESAAVDPEPLLRQVC